MERIEISQKEIRRLEVIQRVLGGGISQQLAAAELLSLFGRQVRRLQRGYEAEDAGHASAN